MGEPQVRDPTSEPGADPWLGGLALLGLGLLLAVLYLNRISLGGPLGQAPDWVVDLAWPLEALHTAVFGPLARDEWKVTGQAHRVRQAVLCLAAASCLYLPACWIVLRRPASPGSPRLAGILAVSIACRFLLVFSPPLLETDPYRYLWDGAVARAGVNPYRFAPEEVQHFADGLEVPGRSPAERVELARLAHLLRDPALLETLVKVNHPNVPTLYPPLAQRLFALAAGLAPGNILILKALVAAIDLGVLLALLPLLRILGRPPEWVLLYGWCPLVLKEYAQSAHYDPLATLFLLAALALLLRGRGVAAGVAAGLAVTGKFFPLVVLVVLARSFGAKGIAAALATIAVMTLPYLGIGARIGDGLLVFGTSWVWNASVFELVRSLTGSLVAAKIVLVPLGILGLLLLARLPEDSPARVVAKAEAAIALLFVLSPVQNPWYGAWLVPFAALGGSLAWPVLSGGMLAYYGYHAGKTWTVTAPLVGLRFDLRWLEYLPAYALRLSESAAGRQPCRAP